MSRLVPDQRPEDDGVLASSAVMAAGTVVSRLSGYVRSTLLAAALGLALHADVFTIANTIPNMLYILLAGGVFNAVLVPQLVRAMTQDADGGEAYTQRVMTVAAMFLAAVTVLLVVAAPRLMDLYLDPRWGDPAMAADRASVVTLARYCLPQVFFYGMFVLVGQVLNARGRFGPMMWAPIANNVISVAVLATYLVAYGPVTAGVPFTAAQERLLGLGATAGIAAQLLILLPYLRSAGFTFRLRFDMRGSGLGHTLRLGVWTVLFVIVNQLAYTVVVRLASSGTAQSAVQSAADAPAGSAAEAAGGAAGTGYAVYSSTFLITMVPHAVITVSLATAILPRLSRYAADGDAAGLARLLGSTLRTALAVVVPFAVLLPLVAPDIANVIWGWGAAARDFPLYVTSLSLFGPGLVFFTVHYLALRGFYALEQTRAVFVIQCAVAATNVAAAIPLVARTDAEHTSPALVVAYTASYAVGAALSFGVLARRLGGGRRAELVRFLVRLGLAVAVAGALAWAVATAVHGLAPDRPGKLTALGSGLAIGLVMAGGYLLLARAMRITEVTSVVSTVARRLPAPRRR